MHYAHWEAQTTSKMRSYLLSSLSLCLSLYLCLCLTHTRARMRAHTHTHTHTHTLLRTPFQSAVLKFSKTALMRLACIYVDRGFYASVNVSIHLSHVPYCPTPAIVRYRFGKKKIWGLESWQNVYGKKIIESWKDYSMSSVVTSLENLTSWHLLIFAEWFYL